MNVKMLFVWGIVMSTIQSSLFYLFIWMGIGENYNLEAALLVALAYSLFGAVLLSAVLYANESFLQMINFSALSSLAIFSVWLITLSNLGQLSLFSLLLLLFLVIYTAEQEEKRSISRRVVILLMPIGITIAFWGYIQSGNWLWFLALPADWALKVLASFDFDWKRLITRSGEVRAW